MGRSEATLHCTATRTTGETENFIALIGWASTSFSLVKVAFLVINWSKPTRATVFPHGTSSTVSCCFPIQITVLWTLFTYKSFFTPGTKFGPMILTFSPVEIASAWRATTQTGLKTNSSHVFLAQGTFL